MEFESKGIVMTVSADTQTKSNGSTFQKCTVKHLDGSLAGKVFFANRTLTRTDEESGETVSKEPVKVGQEVRLYNRVDVEQRQVYTEIGTGVAVDSIDDLFGALESSNASQTAGALAEQQV